MNWLLKTAIKRVGRREQRRLDNNCKDPRHAQTELLKSWLHHNRCTQFGRDHRFAALKNIDEFRQQVPIRDYAEIKPYIDAIIAGRHNVLTHCPPFMFNMTSGTTGTPKYIPWNVQGDRSGGLLMRHWIYRCMQAHPNVLDHHAFCMVSPAIEAYTNSGLTMGSASGRIYQRIPAVVRRHYANPYAVSEIENYDQRYFAALRLSIAKRVSVVSTPNPSTLVRLAEIGNQRKEQLFRAIHDGTLGVSLARQQDIQRSLEKGLKPDPVSARRLEDLAAGDGLLYPKDYWPDLKLIGCWTGGSVGVQLDRLPRYFGPDVPIRDLGYLASEGRMSLPIGDHTPSGILAVNSNFYEFIPEDEIDNPGHTLLCDELDVGKRYYVVLTTASGLYRYDINDVIEVTGWHDKCPMVSFVRKGRDMTNITGEKIHVNQCLMAMRRVTDELRIGVEQYRFIADDILNCYHVQIEPTDWRPTPAICAALACGIDRELATINIEYRQKRRSGRLSEPRVHIMPQGWSAAERRAAIDSGKRDVEFKWRHLIPADQCTGWSRI